MENAASTSNALFCPTTHSYAVIRINPVAMVEHLHDQVAHDAAASMRVKSYLAYIGPVRRLFLGYVALENHVSPPSCTSGPLAPVPRKAMVLLLHLPPSDDPPRTGRGARYYCRDVHPHRTERYEARNKLGCQRKKVRNNLWDVA